MRVWHTTNRKNLDSIREYGLLLSYCQSDKRQAVWVHIYGENEWAETHVRVRHQWETEEIVHIQVDIEMSLLKKHCPGLFYVTEDIPAEAIGRAILVKRVEEVV